MITLLAGGVGAARLLAGLVQVVDPSSITVVANVGDDLTRGGLAISPDLDTITYTLAGQHDPAQGWGLVGESWQAMTMLEQYGGEAWFRLGDRDLGTHLFRTQRLSEGATLSEVTAEIAQAWNLRFRLLPATNDPLATRMKLRDGSEVGFQDYFVRLHHDVEVREVRFAGAESARPAPGVVEAIDGAERVVIAPSNPVVSIAPLLAVSDIRSALVGRRDNVVAVSPIIGGRAVKGPADRLMRELGHDSSASGVAAYYRDLVSTLVFDEQDRDELGAIEALGIRGVPTATLMRDAADAASLAKVVLS